MKLRLSDLDQEDMEYLRRLRRAKSKDTLEFMVERMEEKTPNSKAQASLYRAWEVRLQEIETGTTLSAYPTPQFA